LVTTKLGELEDKDSIKRRIDEAAQYAALEQPALSPPMRLLEHRSPQ
jgi:5-methyltetrahydropteroyltriglutamate--homocysteine methyltransferase